MTLPSSGALTLANVQTEFGGSNPVSLGEYYAGGSYVPSGTSGTYGAVPSSGAIGIRNFYGTSDGVVAITDQTISSGDAITATSTYRISHNGNVYGIVNGGSPSLIEQWCTPTSASSDYEVRATVVSGSLSAGTAGTWFSLGSPSVPEWSAQETTSGFTTYCVLTIEIRTVVGAVVVDSATITLETTVF